MTRRNYNNFNWELLLDGERHIVDLEQIGWDGSISDFRATVHYQADKRRGQARTRKLGPMFMEVQALDCTPLADLQAAAVQRYKDQARQGSNLLLQQQPAPSSAGEDLGDDDLDPDLLLGPCTCGQAPTCLPSCARFS